MSGDIRYQYCDGDLLIERNTYFYSEYHGAQFLLAWQSQRKAAIQSIGPDRAGDYNAEPTRTGDLLNCIRESISNRNEEQGGFDNLDKLVQRFEVTKRVHEAYTEKWRARDVSRFRNLGLYVLLAEVLVLAYRQTERLVYLNALLKIADTLCSVGPHLDEGLLARFQGVLDAERAFVDALSARSSRRTHAGITPVEPLQVRVRQREGIALLACDSARSRAYIQALLHIGIVPERVILMGEDRATTEGKGQSDWNGLLLPDLGTPVAVTCQTHGVPLERVAVASVNTTEVKAALRDIAAPVVVYSGFGGQIVSEDVLSSGPRFLHMHSGWLPMYRGSTTLYYALLNGDAPGVSAIYLDPGIDTGPIIERRHYPVPSAGMDLDLTYDTAIRADLMCRVLLSETDPASPCRGLTQDAVEGCTYYVIHPVLKHVALLSLEQN